MASSQVATHVEDRALAARREAVASLQEDIKLSLGQGGSLPDMLMTAPLAINLLGHIKLLAFSDHALRIRLREPKNGFIHLQRTSLSAAMIQIVDQSSDAFDSAEKNMRSIRMMANVMFGRAGHVQTILMCLQDRGMAKKGLLKSMANFQRDMEKCAEWAEDTQTQFDALVKCVGEVNLAMADETAIASQEEEQVQREKLEAETAKAIRNGALDALKARAGDAQSEFSEARNRYHKTAAKGELSALGAAAVLGAVTSVSTLINTTISVFKDAPKMAMAAVLSGAGIGSHRTNTTTGRGTPNAPLKGPAIDPALLAAEEIETQLLRFNELLNDDLPMLIEQGGYEVSGCASRLADLKKGLGGYQSKHTLSARGMLGEALEIMTAILEYGRGTGPKSAGEWQGKTGGWRKALKPLLNRATTLRSFAASQPGQGFGGSLDTPTLGVSPDDSAYTKVLHQRHQKLLITRSAMNDARNNLERTTNMHLEAQAKIVEIARTMKELESKQATLQETKNILRTAIDVLVAMQSQIRQLTGFFHALVHIISVTCKGHADRYLETIDGGITQTQGGGGGGDDVFTLAYSEQQLCAIREAVIMLRGHFGFVVHSTDLYQEIATLHINPCIRMAAELPLSAGLAEQQEAKRQLQEVTEKSSEAIRQLAHREFEDYRQRFSKRVQDMEDEMAAMGLPAPELDDEENLKAVEDGVREANQEISERMDGDAERFWDCLEDL